MCDVTYLVRTWYDQTVEAKTETDAVERAKNNPPFVLTTGDNPDDLLGFDVTEL